MGEKIYSLQRIMSAIRILAFGTAADALGDYLRLSEDSVSLSLKHFCREIVNIYSEYLRPSSENDLRRIIFINASRGVHGDIGSIDRQRRLWNNCPTAWAGQFRGK